MTPTDAHVLPLMSDPVQRSAWCSEMHTQMGGGHPLSSIRILSIFESFLIFMHHTMRKCCSYQATGQRHVMSGTYGISLSLSLTLSLSPSLSFSSIKVFSFPQSLYQRIHIGQHPVTLFWQNSTEIFPKWKCWSALIAKAKMLRSNQTLVCQNSPGEGQVTHASLGSLTLGLILQHFAWLCYRTISYILDCYNVLLL